METGPYLTDLELENDGNTDIIAKFKKFNSSNNSNKLTTSEPLKKISHVHRKVHKNINVFPPDEYYDLKKAKPGIAFYRTILEYEERRKNEHTLPHLCINFPQTILLQQNQPQLIYSHDGIVKVNTQANLNEYLKSIKTVDTNKVYPCALQGIGNGNFIDFNIYLTNEISNRILPKNQNQFTSKFVRPYGDYPNILRLFYTPKNNRNCKPNIGYKAINRKKIDGEMIDKKYKQIYHYIVDFGKDDLIIVTPMKGKALLEVGRMTQSIIDFLDIMKGIKITEIVVDYIFGEDRLYYFHEIKCIKSVALNSIWDIGSTEQKQEKYKEQTNQIVCKLCSFYFPRSQMTKLVTNKLIAQLLTHLKNRGQCPFRNMTIKSSNLSVSNNVCDLCYELIVAQHQLIDLEREFNSLMNVNTDEIIRVRETNNFISPSLETQLYKWRLFFYVQKVKSLPLEKLQEQQNFIMTLQFNDIKQSFSRSYSFSDIYKSSARPLSSIISKQKLQRKQLVHSSKGHDNKSTLHTNYTNRSSEHFSLDNNIDFQKVKLITFYTKKQDIEHLFEKEVLKFQLSFRNYKYKGDSSTLQNFRNKRGCQRHSCEVLLFDSNYKYCNIQLNVGLMYDGMVKLPMPQILSSSNGNFYFAQQNQSCSPLPKEWVQVISKEVNPVNDTLSLKTSSFSSLRGVASVCSKGTCTRAKFWGSNITQNREQQQQFL